MARKFSNQTVSAHGVDVRIGIADDGSVKLRLPGGYAVTQLFRKSAPQPGPRRTNVVLDPDPAS
jgi:hypothetical protein